MSLFWLSFVDRSKSAPEGEQVPGGGGFLGVTIVRAADPLSAVARAWEIGVNPGGEVGIHLLPGAAESVIPSELIERPTLLTQAEAEAI